MKAYIFDMDGVIVDNCSYHVAAWLEFARAHGRELTERQVLDWMGASNRVYMERLFGPGLPDAEYVRLGEEKESLYRRIYAPHLRPPPGLRRLLDSAHAAGVRCAVATGGPKENADFIIAGAGYANDFDVVVDAACYRRSKPDPECYLRAAELLGVAPADCTVFEDAVGGVKAGKAAGMRVVAITSTMPRAELVAAGADAVVDSFEEVA